MKLTPKEAAAFENRYIKLEECIGLISSKQDGNINVILGTDKNGIIVERSIENLNHIITYGPTGVGKTCFLYNIILSILSKKNELIKFVLVDPKTIEFNCFSRLTNLVYPPINMPAKTIGALKWAQYETWFRFKKFQELQARDISAYNHTLLCEHETEDIIPRVLILIDEIEPIYNRPTKETEDVIRDLTLNGRQAGVHLFLNCQNKLTYNKLFNMFPSRIVFTNTQQGKKPYRGFGHAVFEEEQVIPKTYIDIPEVDVDNLQQYMWTT